MWSHFRQLLIAVPVLQVARLRRRAILRYTGCDSSAYKVLPILYPNLKHIREFRLKFVQGFRLYRYARFTSLYIAQIFHTA
jgi:hypothetical protein